MTTITAEVFIPADMFADPPTITAAIGRGLDAAAEQVRTDFRATVATWDDAETFSIERSATERVIGPDGSTRWASLNAGFTVPPRQARGRAMRFRANYTAKTTPRSLSSRSGGSSGGYVYAKRARGFTVDAREWNAAAADKMQPLLAVIVQRAIDSVIG